MRIWNKKYEGNNCFWLPGERIHLKIVSLFIHGKNIEKFALSQTIIIWHIYKHASTHTQDCMCMRACVSVCTYSEHIVYFMFIRPSIK